MSIDKILFILGFSVLPACICLFHVATVGNQKGYVGGISFLRCGRVPFNMLIKQLFSFTT